MGIFLRWRYLPVASKAAGLGGAATLVLCLVICWVIARADDRDVADAIPAVAAIAATSSLLVATVGAVATWNRQGRQATLQAWTAWSDDTVEARKTLSRSLGEEVLTREQGRALADKQQIPGFEPVPGSTEYRDLGNAVVEILNGLERIASGVLHGVYDARMLKSLGGTTIVRSYQRLLPYVVGRRETTQERHRQILAYTSLEELVKDWERQESELDFLRLKRLRREGR